MKDWNVTSKIIKNTEENISEFPFLDLGREREQWRRRRVSTPSTLITLTLALLLTCLPDVVNLPNLGNQTSSPCLTPVLPRSQACYDLERKILYDLEG